MKTLDDVIAFIVDNADALQDNNVCMVFCRDKKLYDEFENSVAGKEICQKFDNVVVSYYRPSGTAEKVVGLH